MFDSWLCVNPFPRPKIDVIFDLWFGSHVGLGPFCHTNLRIYHCRDILNFVIFYLVNIHIYIKTNKQTHTCIFDFVNEHVYVTQFHWSINLYIFACIKILIPMCLQIFVNIYVVECLYFDQYVCCWVFIYGYVCLCLYILANIIVCMFMFLRYLFMYLFTCCHFFMQKRICTHTHSHIDICICNIYVVGCLYFHQYVCCWVFI